MARKIDNGTAALYDAHLQEYRKLSERWEEVVSRIRMVDDFEDFLLDVLFKPFGTFLLASRNVMERGGQSCSGRS
jgi:hypothetical protein